MQFMILMKSSFMKPHFSLTAFGMLLLNVLCPRTIAAQIDTCLHENKTYHYFDWDEFFYSESTESGELSSASATLHGAENLNDSMGEFLIPEGVNSVVLNVQGSRGGNGAHATASFSGAGGTCVAHGGDGGKALQCDLLLINLSPSDTISYILPSNGGNSTATASCGSCGTGCSFSCTGGSGTDGGNLHIYLNSQQILEISGGTGGNGGRAGTPNCSDGADGTQGGIASKSNHLVLLNSQVVNSGNPILTISY